MSQLPAPGVVETPLLMPLQGDVLVGMLCAPASPASQDSGTGVLVIVGGPQVRSGSHRLFVQLARSLAAAGHAVLRFDVRGMGDSTGEARTFEHLHDDIDIALGALLAQRPGLRRVVLWGLCDGASAALLYLQQRRDARVGGLVLLNPWVRTPQSLAQARVQHYYWQRLAQRGFWRKLLRGGVGLAALQAWWHNLRAAQRAAPVRQEEAGKTAGQTAGPAAPFPERMAQGWRAHPLPTLLVLAGKDITAQEFTTHAGSHSAWRGWLQNSLVTRADRPHADHTFSASTEKDELLRITRQWLDQHFPAHTG